MFRTACFVTLAAIAVPEAARAAPAYLVDSGVDAVDDDVSDTACHTLAGTCTLRAAIMQANHYSGSGNVAISLPAGTYVLSIEASGSDDADNGDLNLNAPPAGTSTISITGAGAATTVIDADHIDRAFNIATRVATISGVTVRNGSAGNGGGIFLGPLGNLTLTDAVVELNQAGQGGGIHNAGTMTLDNVVVKDNNGMFGAGIFSLLGLTIRNSTIKSNTSSYGGGIYNSGILTIDRSTISANSSSFSGGGIYNTANAATSASMTMTNSTVSNNHAQVNGGGMTSTQNGTLVVKVFNSSFIANEAAANPVSGGKGGGVYSTSGYQLSLSNSLIAGNYLSGGSSYEDCYNLGSLITGGGLNLFSATLDNCGPFANPSAVGSTTTVAIGPLQANGGPTFTHALLEGSNAIGAVASASCIGYDSLPVLVDQRGVSRVTDGFCDVGAFEYDFGRIFANGFDSP